MPTEPPPVAVHVLAPRPAGFGSAPLLSLQDPQQPLRIPQTDIFVEVIGAPHPRRKMASYSAPEEVVVKRLNKKLGDLKKYSERFD